VLTIRARRTIDRNLLPAVENPDSLQEGNDVAVVIAPPKNRRKVFTWKNTYQAGRLPTNASKEVHDPKMSPLLTPTP
jgi:hypothetical protein